MASINFDQATFNAQLRLTQGQSLRFSLDTQARYYVPLIAQAVSAQRLSCTEFLTTVGSTTIATDAASAAVLADTVSVTSRTQLALSSAGACTLHSLSLQVTGQTTFDSHVDISGRLNIAGLGTFHDIGVNDLIVNGAARVFGIVQCAAVSASTLTVVGALTAGSLVVQNESLELGVYTLHVNALSGAFAISKNYNDLITLSESLAVIALPLNVTGKLQSPLLVTSEINTLKATCNSLTVTDGILLMNSGSLELSSARAVLSTSVRETSFVLAPDATPYATLRQDALVFPSWNIGFTNATLALTAPATTSLVLHGRACTFADFGLALSLGVVASTAATMVLSCRTTALTFDATGDNIWTTSSFGAGALSVSGSLTAATAICTALTATTATVTTLTLGSVKDVLITGTFAMRQVTGAALNAAFVGSSQSWVVQTSEMLTLSAATVAVTGPLSVTGDVTVTNMTAQGILTSADTRGGTANFAVLASAQCTLGTLTCSGTTQLASLLSLGAITCNGDLTVTGSTLRLGNSVLTDTSIALTLRSASTNVVRATFTDAGLLVPTAVSCTRAIVSDTLQAGTATAVTLSLSSTTNASSTATGALIVQGGAAIGKDLWIAGNTTLLGDLIVYGKLTNVETTTTTLRDNIVLLNASPTTKRDSGISVQRFQLANDNGTGDIVNGTGGVAHTLATQNATLTASQIRLTTAQNPTGYWIRITSGYSADQVRQVVSYDTASQIATLASPFTMQNPATGDLVMLFGTNYPTLSYNESFGAFAFQYSAVSPISDRVVSTGLVDVRANVVTCLSANINGVSTTPHPQDIAAALSVALNAMVSTKLLTLPSTAIYARVSVAVVPTGTGGDSNSGYEVLLVNTAGTWTMTATQIGPATATFAISGLDLAITAKQAARATYKMFCI